MQKKGGNYAFVDSQNVNLAIRALGWKLDFKRFRVYLREKYAVEKAFLFVGFVDGNNNLYTALQEAGFICIFKPTLIHKDGSTKGNCDAELVLQAMIEYPKYAKAVIVTGDGDFYCLAKYLLEKDKLAVLLIPDRFKFSALLKFRIFRPYLRYMNDLEQRLGYKKERPRKDGTLRGDLSRS
ncbi:MAG TPA: NYN domain-containing protein [Candidatus Peribacteraceae bacterium]|nr:NYN domain-containing protein [Candidatus Peribacteraceae bacterium]